MEDKRTVLMDRQAVFIVANESIAADMVAAVDDQHLVATLRGQALGRDR